MIAKFQYTFFDAFGQNHNIPDVPITPFPTLFSTPVYRPANNTLELTVSNFFYEDPKTRAQTALDVYLGNLGPLRHRVYQTGAPASAVTPFVPSLGVPPGLDGIGTSVDHTPGVGTTPIPPLVPGPPRYMTTSGPMHTIAIVEMPPLGDVIKALEEDAIPPSAEAGGPGQKNAEDEESGDGDQQRNHGNGSTVPSSSIAGRSLPLLFIRASDGVGYHSGRTIACENVFQTMDLTLGSNGGSPSSGHIDTGWLAAAQVAAAATDGGLHGWTLRVM